MALAEDDKGRRALPTLLHSQRCCTSPLLLILFLLLLLLLLLLPPPFLFLMTQIQQSKPQTQTPS